MAYWKSRASARLLIPASPPAPTAPKNEAPGLAPACIIVNPALVTASISVWSRRHLACSSRCCIRPVRSSRVFWSGANAALYSACAFSSAVCGAGCVGGRTTCLGVGKAVMPLPFSACIAFMLALLFAALSLYSLICLSFILETISPLIIALFLTLSTTRKASPLG